VKKVSDAKKDTQPKRKQGGGRKVTRRENKQEPKSEKRGRPQARQKPNEENTK